jgi:flagellar biosynthetic protein FliR
MDTAVSSLFAPGSWPAFVLISARLTGLVALAPFWSMASIPRSVRGALIVVIAAGLVPVVAKPAFPDHVLEMPVPIMMELVVGTAIGLAAAAINYALMLASEVVSLQTGLSLGQVLAPNLDLGGPAISQIYALLGLTTFVAIGGPVMLLGAVTRSLAEFPPGAVAGLAGGAHGVLAMTGSVFTYAVQIAAPVMVALTVTNVAMAILSRAVPQLNAMAMSFAVTLGVGLVMLGASLPVMVALVTRWFQSVPLGTDGLLRSLLLAPR